uniref:Ig-like domain-containing protein n=1 Tax=Scleropages formosus TaxID=113540 RepID=A0A8C9S906_SCLFO
SIKQCLLTLSDPVVAVAGEDVVLPCYLKPNISAVDLHVEWFRVQTNNPLVHFYRDHEDRNEKQIPSYRGRTSLFPEELMKGNTSLKIKNVRGSDNGEYKCFIQAGDCYAIFIFIAVGTQPVISNEGYKKGGISLVCESKGWYPQPQVLWMDSGGHRLPAGHTETHTDSMGLFTVRQRVIVQERETNSFTCRIIQQLVNEIKEISTNIPGELNMFLGRLVRHCLGLVLSFSSVCGRPDTPSLHRSKMQEVGRWGLLEVLTDA